MSFYNEDGEVIMRQKCEICGKHADAGDGICLNCLAGKLDTQRQSAKAQGADEFEQSDILFGKDE